MPIFAFTAGSLGDILALIGVVRGLSSSLSDIYSQSGALRELVDDVALFSRAIDEIKKALDHRSVGMHEDVLRGIGAHLKICRDILLVVTDRITVFNDKMAGRGGLTMEALRMYWAVAAWEILGGREEVNRLRARLRDQIGAIQIYLSLSQSYDQEAVLVNARRQHSSVDRISNAAVDMQRCFGLPAVPSCPFFDEHTGLPYAPCARTSIEHVKQLFGDMHIQLPVKSVVVHRMKDIWDLVEDSAVNENEGLVGAGWGFDIYFYFTLGVFGCLEVFIGIPPRAARSDAAAIQSLCRDLVMVGHIQRGRPRANQISYQIVKARGDYLNCLVKVYEEICGEFTKLPWNWVHDDKLEKYLRTFPDPEFLDADVLPRMRQLSDIAFDFYDRKSSADGCDCYPWSVWGTRTGEPPVNFDRVLSQWDLGRYERKEWREDNLKALNIYFQQVLGLQQPVEPEFQLAELWRLVRRCPLLDPAIVAQYKLAENIKIKVWRREVSFCDSSLDLVRVAGQVQNFWQDL